MNFNLSQIPARTQLPRSYGITMVTDKGLSVAEAAYLAEGAAPYVDFVKLAFGTAYVMPQLREKIRIYQSHNIPVYFGGLLFEAFLYRNQLNDYLKLVEENNIRHIEISDGSVLLAHAEKCGYINRLAASAIILSEVGSRDKDRVQVTPPYKWIELMQRELEAGATYVIAEARETGTVGLYRDSGEVREGLVQEILTHIPAEKIIWEAPQKDQQLFFINLLGCNANLGNIAPAEVISLETMRIGLRGDSFHFFLDKDATPS